MVVKIHRHTGNPLGPLVHCCPCAKPTMLIDSPNPEPSKATPEGIATFFPVDLTRAKALSFVTLTSNHSLLGWLYQCMRRLLPPYKYRNRHSSHNWECALLVF